MSKKIRFAALFMVVLLVFSCLAGCADENKDIWSEAVYTEDAEFGDGAKTIVLKVQAEEKSVNLIVKTDEEILGKALIEHELIDGEDGAYGLYVKKVNGMTADYSVDNTYWAITKNGESLLTGVDSVEIADGEQYEFTYTKQ